MTLFSWKWKIEHDIIPFTGYGLCHSPFQLRKNNHARRSRKRPNIDLIIKPSRDTVGYIRLSVRNKDSSSSIKNQKLIFEEWEHQHQTPIMYYYIDNGFSGNRFDCPAFQQMIQDIFDGKIECIVVKDLSRLGRDYITVGYHLEIFSPR